MKLYASLAVITAVYAIALTLSATDNPQGVVWNGVIGALLSLALAISTVPLGGPLLYETALQILTSTLNPPIDLALLVTVLRIAPWAVNLIFTAALILYLIRWKRPLMRKILRVLLF
nr:hypothetical protein [Pyrobaculum sp.]